MTHAERRILWGCNMLALALIDHGVQCAICFPLGEAPCVRVPGAELLEAIATDADRYEVWSLGEVTAAVPLRIDLSIAEVVDFLSRFEGRA
jgi:hypothetical protein